MAVTCERTRTLYYPVPKVACTTVKKRFWELKHGNPFPTRPGFYRRIKRYLGIPIHMVTIQSELGYETTDFDPSCEVPDGYSTLAIIRDPIDRLSSAWSSKVTVDLFRRHGETQAVQAAGLPVSPTFSEFIEKFDIYREISRPVRRHTESYTKYLGSDLDWFDYVFRLEEMSELEEYLSKRAGQTVTIPVENKSTNSSRNGQLSTDLVDLIRDITKREYELLAGYYSFESAVERYLSTKH